MHIYVFYKYITYIIIYIIHSILEVKCLKSHTSSSFYREKTKAQNDVIKVSPLISRASAKVCIFHSQLTVQKHT